MKKSKFIIFILSFLPGLSHLYAGFKERAIVFFIAFFGVISAIIAFNSITHSESITPILAILLPVIWFVSLVDALFLVDKMRNTTDKDAVELQGAIAKGIIDFNNKKLIAVVLSFIPGAGHMYLGLQKQGLQFMGIFFFSAFMMGWLNMSLFLFILPIIWFYSLFDAYHCSEEDRAGNWENDLYFVNWLKGHPKWVGWGCIILGGIVILERIITPLLAWQLRNYLQTGLVAIVLIFIGIKLLIGSKQAVEKEVDEECEIVE